MRLRFSTRTVLACSVVLLSLASVGLLMTAVVGVARQPDAKQALPDGLRHVPADAIGFVHIRAGEFLKTEIGTQFLQELRKDREASSGLKKMEETLGMSLADVDTVTVVLLALPRAELDPWRRGPMFDRGFRDKDRFMFKDKDFMPKDKPKIFEKEDFKDKDNVKPPPLTKEEEDALRKKIQDETKKVLQRKEKDPDPIKEGKDKKTARFGTTDTVPVSFQPDFNPRWEMDPFDRDDPSMFMGPTPVVIVSATKEIDRKKILKSQLFEPKPFDRYEPRPNTPSVLFLSDRTVMLGMPWELARFSEMQARKTAPKSQPLKSALALGTEPHLVVAGGHIPIEWRRMMFSPFYVDMRAFASIAPLLQTEAGATLDIGKSVDLTLQFNAPTDASAENTLHAAKSLRTLAEIALEKSKERGESGGWKLDLEKSLAKALADAKFEQKGTLVRADFKMDVSPTLAKRFVKDIVESLRQKGDRTAHVNNLKQIALAMHNFHDANKFLPAGVGTDATKPLLSWRVAILPYIDEGPLYQQFDLDKPWDHPNNMKLIAKMPRVYQFPGVETKEGMTHYRSLIGPSTMLTPVAARGKMLAPRYGLAQVPDGTSNTIMVVEAKEPMIWTKPDDLPFDPKGVLPKLGVYADGFHVALGDGSVRFVRSTISEMTLRNAIMTDDGNPLGADW